MRLSLLHRLEHAHEDSLWATAWSPSSNLLVTGSVDETVKFWEEVDDVLQPRHTLTGVSLGAVSLTIDSCGQYGAVCALDSSISVWNMADYTPGASIQGVPPSEAWGIAFVPRASQDDPLLLAIAAGSSHRLRLWDVTAGSEVLSVELPVQEKSAEAKQSHPTKQRQEKFALSVAVSPDKQTIAVGSMDGGVSLIDSETGQVRVRPSGHFRPVRSVAFTPDGRHLLTACDDMHINMYDCLGGSLIESFSGHESWVLSVAVHPDGTAFTSAGSDAKLKLWDLTTRTCAQTVTDHTDQVWSVAWRSDGSRCASVSDDGSICLYDFL